MRPGRAHVCAQDPGQLLAGQEGTDREAGMRVHPGGYWQADGWEATQAQCRLPILGLICKCAHLILSFKERESLEYLVNCKVTYRILSYFEF